MGNSKFIFISIALAAISTACEDRRSAIEQLEPWVETTAPLSWQGPRAQDHALVFTTNLEFVVVKKLLQPRTVCSSSSGSGGLERVETEVMGETEVRVPGETRTICEEQDKMDTTRVSRVKVVLKPKQGAKNLNPAAIQEVALGYHAKDSLKKTLYKPDTLLSLKARGLKLTQLNVRLGDGARFQPGDEISIEATVEPGAASLSTLGSPVALPQFKSEERATQGLKRDQP